MATGQGEPVSDKRDTVTIWAVVDAEGELVDAKTTRTGAFKRVAFLDEWAEYNQKQGKGATATAHQRNVLAPFKVVRCVGEFMVECDDA